MRRILMKKSLVAVGLLVAGLAFGVRVNSAEPEAKKEPKQLRDYMRQKLHMSSQVLEGLAVEDFALIKTGADSLYKMSAAEIFNVVLDDEYREYNREFRSSINKLRDAADEKNLDDATLQWIDAVKSCVECHKYVRAQRGLKK